MLLKLLANRFDCKNVIHYLDEEKRLAPRPKLIPTIWYFFGFEFSLCPLCPPIWLRVIGKLYLIFPIDAHDVKISLVIVAE